VSNEFRARCRGPMGLAWYSALVMTSGPLTPAAMAALGPLIVSDLQLSAAEFGLLWFVTFGSAAISSIFVGTLCDHTELRFIMVGIFTGSLIALAVAGNAHSRQWLMWAAVLAGLAQSSANPATNALIAGIVPPSQRGIVLAIKQSGVQISQFLAGVALPSLAVLWGWRPAVLSLSLVPVLGILITYHCVPKSKQMRRSERLKAPALHSVVIWLIPYAFLMGIAIQATNVYLPLYANAELGLSVRRAGFLVAVLGGVGFLARLAWGVVVNRITEIRKALVWLAVAASVSVVSFRGAAMVGEWLLWVGVVTFSVSALAANVLIVILIVRTVPMAEVGRSTGYVWMGLFCGFMLGPISFGILVDTQGGYGAGWSALGSITLALVILVAVWTRQPAHGSAQAPGP
jgi:predicted MFS family arabinose efflux permease